MTFAAIVAVALQGALGAPQFDEAFIFDPDEHPRGHVHASSIVELPNGDLRAVWYENGEPLPPPYYQGDRDKSDDVRIGGSRKAKDAESWDAPFVMIDTFGVSDNNPAMVVDDEGRLWLVYGTLLGVPDWTWGSALVRYAISSDYDGPGPPRWETQNILIPRPEGFEELLDERIVRRAEAGGWSEEQIAQWRERMSRTLERPLVFRVGWMPRAHPLVRSDGTVILPLSNENFNIAMMFFTADGGKTWTQSKPVPEAGLTQPTVAELPDGRLLAHFRNSSGWIRRSVSTDGGQTWGEVSSTDLVHPGAGIEAVQLASGRLAMVYNDVERSPRDKLAVSLSEDGGETWPYTRHIEQVPGQRFDYPSMVQGADGTIHVTYSYNLVTVKHVWFNEEWVMEGD